MATVGMLLAVGYLVITNTSRREICRRVLLRLSPWLWWLGIALLVFAAWRDSAKVFEIYPHWAIELAFALGFGCCMLAILFNGSGFLRRIFAWAPLRRVGLISFSLYLWQFPLINALESGFSADLFKHPGLPLALVPFALVECTMVLVALGYSMDNFSPNSAMSRD